MAACSEPLTPQQAKCLSVIEQFIIEHGYAPSYREILASQGLDSREVMSAALREEAASLGITDPGFGAGLRAASEVVRRGTVKG